MRPAGSRVPVEGSGDGVVAGGEGQRAAAVEEAAFGDGEAVGVGVVVDLAAEAAGVEGGGLQAEGVVLDAGGVDEAVVFDPAGGSGSAGRGRPSAPSGSPTKGSPS